MTNLAFDAASGMGDVITTKQRNIEELGFPQELHGSADGVFLDLPGPWHVSSQPLFAANSCSSGAGLPKTAWRQLVATART